MIEDDGLIDVDGHAVFHLAMLAEPLHVPASGHFYLVPSGDVVCGVGKALWPRLWRRTPMELPRAVEAQEVLGAFGQDAKGGTGIREGKEMRSRLQFVERQQARTLPLNAAGRCGWSVEETFEGIIGTHAQGECRKNQGGEEAFHGDWVNDVNGLNEIGGERCSFPCFGRSRRQSGKQ